MGHHCRVNISPHRGRVRALLLTLLVAAGVSLTWAGPASAHARLVSISPADGATLTTAPTEVVVTFDDTVTPGLSVVTVKSSNGANVAQGKATEAGPVVTQALLPDLPGGAYTVAWKIVSDDGHPVSGTSTFTVQTEDATPLASATSTTSSSSATTTATATSSPSTSVAAPGAGGGIAGAKGLLYILALAAIVYGILGLARARRKQRAAQHRDQA